MKEVQVKAYSSSLGLSNILGLIFVVLKLLDKISWSWWWVTSPFWIPWAIVGTIIFAGILIAGFFQLLEKLEKR